MRRLYRLCIALCISYSEVFGKSLSFANSNDYINSIGRFGPNCIISGLLQSDKFTPQHLAATDHKMTTVIQKGL